jgi:Ser/Thr protein kinase RdoA (MazF antagonist)
VTILTWIKGRVLQQNERKLRDFVHLGRLVGQLHDHVSKWTPPERPDRRTYDAEGVMGPQAAYPLEGLSRDHLPDEVREGLRTVYRRLQVIEEELGRGPDHFGFIHFDLSFSNVLFTAREARPIDFDECGFGTYLQDLAVALAGPYGRPDFQARYEAVITGYREVRALSGEQLVHLPMFLALRAAALILWSAHSGKKVSAQWQSRMRLQLDERLFPVKWEV